MGDCSHYLVVSLPGSDSNILHEINGAKNIMMKLTRVTQSVRCQFWILGSFKNAPS